MADLRTLRPSALSGTVNDYSPSSFGTAINRILQDCSAPSTITGLVALLDGTVVIIENISASHTLTISNEGAGSTSVNRVIPPGGADLVLQPLSGAKLIYDDVTQRWRIAAVGNAGGGGGGAPTDAEYIVGALNGDLTAERLVTDTASVTWDLGTAGQAKANVTAESAQDAVGAILADTATIDLTYDDATPQITADVKDGSVTYAKMQDVSATDRFLGRKTAGAGDVEELTGTEATARLNIFTDALKGLSPASGGGTTNFLRADGAWSAPSGAGGAALTRLALAAAGSGASGADITWVVLTSDSTFQNALTTIMTLTGVGTGTYHARLAIRYQSSATTTGIGFACDHTGTVAFWLSSWFMITTGAAAATGVGDQVSAVVTGQMAEGKSERVKNTLTTASAGVDTINADMLAVMDVLFQVTATGSFVFKAQAETANNVVVKAGTIIELHKIGV